MKFFFLLHAILQFHWQVITVESQFESPPNATCACPNEVLTYTCIVDGGNVTIWRGSAFDCDRNEIILHHRDFSNRTLGKCNDGAIQGESVTVDGNHYTSRLNVTVHKGLNNKIITCSSDLMQNIGKSEIKLAVFRSPTSVYLADAQKEKLLFSWNSVASNDCSSVQYNIISDCGACPTVTNMTTATCSDLQLTTNPAVCNFRVSHTLFDQDSKYSSPEITARLKVPNVPQVNIIPSYSNNQLALERLFIIRTEIHTEDIFNISGNISGSPISYTVYGSNPVSGASFNSMLDLTLSSHEELKSSGHSIELPTSFYCPQLTTINVIISAANKLGEGPPSNPFIIECTNNFVQVVYNETNTESTISCVFKNQSDVSEKSCCITYGLCDQKMSQNSLECRIKSDVSDSVSSGQMYCYTAIASNETYSVKVKGSFTAGFDHQGNISTAVTVVAIVIPSSIILCFTCTTAIMIFCACIIKKRKRRLNGDDYHILIDEDPLRLPQYLTEYDFPATLRLHNVRSDSNLRQYVTKTLSVEFKRGHAYYEFTNEIENILQGKQVLLQDKTDTKKWFQLVQPEETVVKFYGEGIVRSSFGENYTVFIQSFGSGARHLPKGSRLLYNRDDQVEPDVLPLVPVCSEHFAHKVIDSEEGCRVKEFCTQNKINTAAFNIFLTMEHLPEAMRNQRPRDVILMDMRSKELFTGPKAHQMFDSKNRGESQHDNEQWKVFALLGKNKQDLVLTRDSEILYQDPRYMNGKYEVVEVDEDNVRMSKFIEGKLNCQFEDGKAFYEATENEEDFLYYRKILRPDIRKELNHGKQLEMQPLVEYFYAIPGVPCKTVRPEQLRLDHHKIFVQSTSQGSRCLKKEDKLLYLKEYISIEDHKVQVEAHHSRPNSVFSEDEHRHTPQK